MTCEFPPADWRSDCGRVRLYCGDCLEILPRLPSGAVDAVITDPPYGIRYSPSQNSSKAWGPKTFVGDCVVKGDDEPFNPSPLLGFPTVVLCGANHYASRLPATSEWVVWDKRDGISSNDFADCELLWTNKTGVARIFRHYWCGALRASERGEQRVHPTQKPVALARWILDRYTKPGDAVADFYMGSGTTGVACIQTGRRFIGVELNREYFDIAVNRIQRALSDERSSLFPAGTIEPPPGQKALF